MKQIDMSDKAVTARLKRVAQLRRLGLSLQKAKLPSAGKTAQPRAEPSEPSQPSKQSAK